MDTDFERKLANPLLISQLSVADEALETAFSNLTDSQLSRILMLVKVVKSGDEHQSTTAMGLLEQLVGTLTTAEFEQLDKCVNKAFDNRFGPVSGWL